MRRDEAMRGWQVAAWMAAPLQSRSKEELIQIIEFLAHSLGPTLAAETRRVSAEAAAAARHRRPEEGPE